MTPPRLRLLAACACLALVGGCGHSAETHLLTLDLAPPAAMPAPYAGPPVRVTSVQIPAGLDRLEFARAIAPTELKLQDQYRWSASLGELARETMVRDLAARLPAGSVLPPDSGMTRGTRHADIAILALTARPEATTMDVIVSVAVDGGTAVVRRQLALTQPHGADPLPTDIAADYSVLLGKTADAIVEIMRAMPRA